MKIRFARRARNQLAAIQAYLSPRSPQGARRVADALQSAVSSIAAFPRAGTRAASSRFRKWVVAGTPYVIIYVADDVRDEVTILGVFHAAQNRDEGMK